MAPLKGVDEGWCGEETTERAKKKLAQEVLREDSDGEEERGMSGCCSFLKPRRSMSGRLSASGVPFARLSTEDPAEKVKSGSVCSGFFFCCREEERRTTTTVEVRAADRKWQVDVDEEEYVKPPCWKPPVRKVRAQYRRPRVSKSSAEWMNYDARSYLMNFDDGCCREHCSSFLYADEKGDAVSRARAMHEALCKKFASSRAMQDCPGLTTSRNGSRQLL